MYETLIKILEKAIIDWSQPRCISRNTEYGLCKYFVEANIHLHLTSEVRLNFRERLLLLKPIDSSSSTWWFPLNVKGREQRLQVVKELLEHYQQIQNSA